MTKQKTKAERIRQMKRDAMRTAKALAEIRSESYEDILKDLLDVMTDFIELDCAVSFTWPAN